jgi:hypothetical protein
MSKIHIPCKYNFLLSNFGGNKGLTGSYQYKMVKSPHRTASKVKVHKDKVGTVHNRGIAPLIRNCTPREETPVPIEQEARRAAAPVRMFWRRKKRNKFGSLHAFR